MQKLNIRQDFCDWFCQFEHPCLITDWAKLERWVTLDGGVVKITIPYANHELKDALMCWIESQFEHKYVEPFQYQISTRIKALETHLSRSVVGVKNIIAVTSAKGGVGKSTTAVNLALAFSASGARVGLLDADIYGPSVPLMLGTTGEKPEVRDNKWMQPIHTKGIYTQSIGYLVSQDEAAIWRGPMASKALAQLLNETEWPDLDYLFVDMPPGTGDIQLSLAQQVPVTGAVIVTTPQDLALADARKGAVMFEKVEVPVIGVIENMSYHICSHCGEKENIFGMGGAVQMSQELSLDLLAQLPLHIQIREDIDKGLPSVVGRPNSEHAREYFALAQKVSAKLYWCSKEKPEAISFTMLD